ncbi:MAG TPA: 50S ribosomal protein L25 [Candidatus Marinimicrobia bacterium]|nr:50S ribosomal protein L25 [Candidatus Neomarinimicrobiota bacterium]
MANYKLNTDLRTNLHKRVNKQLRKEGKIPAVYYFHREKPLPLAVDLKELRSAIHSGAHIIELQMGNKKHICIIRDLQHDPVSDEIIHADFMGITLQEDITVDVPIVVEGSAIGVKNFGGVLAQHLWEIEVKCKATDIPDNFTVNVANLNIGDSITVGDLVVPEHVELLTPTNSSIVSVVKATGLKTEEELEAGEELEEGEEGEESEEESEE